MPRKNSWLLLFFICLLASMTLARTAERNMKKEEEIWQKLEAISPISIETFKKTTEAMDDGISAQAARMRRYGSSLIDLGKRNEGIALLEKAKKKDPSPENLRALAQALLPQEGQQLPSTDLSRALQLAQLAYYTNPHNEDSGYAVLLAQIALQVDNKKVFREAVKTLALCHPDLMETHYYKAIVAAMNKQWIEAQEEVEKAERLGLSQEKVSALLNSGIKRKAAVRRYIYYSLYFLAAWVMGLVLLFLFGKAMSKMTLRWLETSDPNAGANHGHRLLRKWYRRLITVGGLYYYFSMPVVLLIALVLFGFSIHAIFKLDNTPIKLFAFLGIGLLVTIYSLIRSLLVRTKGKDPGRSLGKEEAPKLWALTQEVAGQIGTRPIDEIRLTPGTDIAVYERGSFRERAQDRAHRVLVLGVATLNDFKINSFRAVLAHEYGHFSHRDTAGGEVAIRVNRDMMNFALAMMAQNQAVPWNVAFQFLRLYHFIFRRISHGATRLQEVMADRIAVRIYGASDFEEGLQHIIRREVEFEDSSYWEIANASRERRALQNFYEVKTAGENIEEKIREVVNRSSTEDDTHPAPAERFRLAKRIVSSEIPSAEGMVWDLFNDKQGLTNEMSHLIEQLMRKRGYKG